MEDTFVNERDVFDAFLGNYKDGIFFKDKNFCRNVTGLLFRYFLGGGFTYYHNEFAANKLNDSNLAIFKYLQYTTSY
ncbi:MAG: hypothetical protein EOP45_14620 [Sphingobacteriaceae bacterium]|nr:MAG: hypothetical protein EOP45_14620 [Sphingobacteriaceae bacterium]